MTALRLVAALFALIGIAFIIIALPFVKDFVRVPAMSTGFIFGLANLLVCALLLCRLEWGRRLGIFIIGFGILLVGTGLVLSILGSMFWAHADLTRLVLSDLVLAAAYVWMLIALSRTDVQSILA